MGRLDDARDIIARLRAITPVVVPDVGDPAQVNTASMTCGVVAVHLSRCADCSRIFVQSAAAGNWRSCSFN
jgi:hypothetical protein